MSSRKKIASDLSQESDEKSDGKQAEDPILSDKYIDTIWDALYDTTKIIIEDPKYKKYNLSLDKEAKTRFKTLYKNKYKLIKDNYMDEETDKLDRHKIAAITITSFIQSNYIKIGNPKVDGILFTGVESTAVNVALSLMYQNLQLELKGTKHESNNITGYIMPYAMTCDTPYLTIFCRNLLYIKQNAEWSYNELDLSDRLFLIEYLTLREHGIGINVFRELNNIPKIKKRNN